MVRYHQNKKMLEILSLYHQKASEGLLDLTGPLPLWAKRLVADMAAPFMKREVLNETLYCGEKQRSRVKKLVKRNPQEAMCAALCERGNGPRFIGRIEA